MKTNDTYARILSGEVSAAEALGLGPKDARRLIGFAVAMAEKEQLVTAEAAAEVATQADATYVDAWLVLGSTRARQRNASAALEAYARAAELDDRNPRLWCDVAEIKLSVYDYDGAVKALEQGLRCDPKAKTPAGKRIQALIAKTYEQIKR